MSKIARGRIVRHGEATVVDPCVRTSAGDRARTRIARAEVDAHHAAAQIKSFTKRRVEQLLTQAKREARAVVEQAAAEAKEHEQAKLAALYLALRAADERRAERDLDRAMDLAVVLAERLIGAALDVRPVLVVSLANQALAEARAARCIVLEAHPADAGALSSHLSELGLPDVSFEVRQNSTLARGELCIHTELGNLDAKLTPRLERLAAALRDALKAS